MNLKSVQFGTELTQPSGKAGAHAHLAAADDADTDTARQLRHEFSAAGTLR